MKRSEVIARDLAEYIVDSRLPAGAMLPREKDMVEQLGVGRTTLREALRILETRGVLTIRSGPGGGPVVRHPEPQDLTESLTLILQFGRATLIEVMEARIWLEPTAARMAASRIARKEVQKLVKLNEEMQLLVDRPNVGLFDPNQRFHAIIAAASGNLVVQVFSETMLTVSNGGELEFYTSKVYKQSAVDGHREIIEALEAKDPDRAEAAMRAHVTAAKNRRVKAIPELMTRPLRWIQ
jgi:DNA-binding FadR family transcriptional regulator